MARGKKAKPKSAPKNKKTPAPKKAKAKAKAKPRLEKDEQPDVEPSDTELMLQALSCPTSTADRLSEVCEASVLRVKEDLTGIAAAELVWRARPEGVALATAVQQLAAEFERHAAVMLSIYDQMRVIAENDDDHNDLEIPDVIDRLRPLINSMTEAE
jgi:hypothetical protein